MRCAAAIAALALLFLPGRSLADETLLLAVVVNGHAIGKIGEFVERDSELLARPAELRELGIKVPGDGTALVPLAAIAGLKVRLDGPTQTLYISAAPGVLLPALLLAPGIPGAAVPVESGIGAALDYDVLGTAIAGQSLGSGSFDLRAFSPWGTFSSGFLGYAGTPVNGAGPYSAIRLDTVYAYADFPDLRWYRLGDFINGGLGWTRPVRMGGVQVQSDFTMRPDLVTFPLPSVGGSAAVPSTVDVLVNGSRVFSRQVAPGPFEIPQLPVVTGGGNIAMTVTNALGQQVTTTLPFYASANMLAAGLQTWSAEIGAVRRDWGIVSDDYGPVAGSATWRRGLSPLVTLEAHAEGTSGLAAGGAGALVNVGEFGVANLSLAGSGLDEPGAQVTAGLQRIASSASLGAFASLASRNFRDLAAVNGDPVPQRQLNAYASLSFGRFGSAGLSYTSIDRTASQVIFAMVAPVGGFLAQNTVLPGGTVATTSGAAAFLPVLHARIVSGNYSVDVGRLSFFATAFRDFAPGGGGGAILGVTVPLGPRSSAGVSAGAGSGSGYAQVQATQSPVLIGDWGYQLYGQAGNPDQGFGLVEYKSPWGLLSAGASRIGNESAVRGEAQGAVSFADEAVFASNTINDAFAVVDTEAPGIRVYSENRLVDRTDASGRLLVPDLRSFDVNNLSIDPADVPVDASVPDVSTTVRPQYQSGVVVKFPVRISHGALLRLVDEKGLPLPVGSVATLKATGAATPVGYDGEAYLENLARHNELGVERPDGSRCGLAFGYRPKKGEIPTIGPLTCREVK